MCGNISERTIPSETNPTVGADNTPPSTPIRVRATPPTTPEPSPQVRGPGGMGTAGWRVGTLNFCGFKRVTGGLEMGCAQIRRVMADSELDVLVVTEHKMGGGYDPDQVVRLLKKAELKCVVAGGKSPGESHGTGVMLVWRDEEGGHRRLRSNNHSRSDDGRVVSAEFTNPTAGRKAHWCVRGVWGIPDRGGCMENSWEAYQGLPPISPGWRRNNDW